MIKILLDAGHYKNYNKGSFPKYYEGNMTIILARMLKEEIENNYLDVKVDLTHNGLTKEIGVYRRGTLSKGYDAIYSLHSNSVKDSEVKRVVIVTPHNIKLYDDFALKLGNAIKQVMEITQPTQVYKKETSKGNEYYGLLRGAKDVGVNKRFIIEHGFHSNYQTSKWLYENKNLEKLAKVESEIIAEFHNLKKKYKKIRIIKDVNYRSSNHFLKDNVVGVAKKGDAFTIDKLVLSDTTTKMYKLKSGYYITTSKKYVEEI